jgi:phosphoribosylamine--glycine ligase
MKVLVIGGGGREHALAWKLAQSPRVQQVFVAPGNGGTACDARLKNIPLQDIDELADFASQEGVALTVVGPEAPLAAGVVDTFLARGLRIFGPRRAAAQLESSKVFAKDFMRRHRIPTAEYAAFSDPAAAHAYIEKLGAPIVIKADGLAAGKGVVVAMNLPEAHKAIDDMLGSDSGDAKNLGIEHNDGKAQVVIEEFLQGEEASFIVLADGKNVLALATSQDHKRLLEGDLGPNTGGMGAYSPAPVVTPAVHARAMETIILPTLAAMAKEGHPYTGFLYAGLMINRAGHPKALEFNCRLGDPETQPILLRLQSDLFEVLMHATHQTLDQVSLSWDERVALGVVLAAPGYPQKPTKGDVITGISSLQVADPEAAADSVVFHAGTSQQADGRLLTSGGRVLCVTALGDTVQDARQKVFEAMAPIQFEGMQYRRDIGWRAALLA